MKRLSNLEGICISTLLTIATAAVPSLQGGLLEKAQAGDAEAQFQLAEAYEDGNGMPQDDELAAQWYRKSAEQGNAKAENGLGVLYRLGHGVPRDKEEAFRWYRKAAKQGLPEADFNVAISYYNGDGVASDLNRAYAWMVIAKEHRSTEAGPALAKITEEIHGRTTFATDLLAELYEAGRETPQNLKAAFDIYLERANSKEYPSDAQLKLCQFYQNGLGVQQDPVKAKSWCKKAAKSDSSEALVFLGRMAENGIGGPKNLKEAEGWYGKAAEQLVPEGFMSLGRLKLQEGSHESQRDAYYWFYLASTFKIRGAAEEAQRAAGLSDSEIGKAQKKAAEWRKKHGQP